jgi:hypothetical protein
VSKKFSSSGGGGGSSSSSSSSKVTVSCALTEHNTMKAYWGVEV